VSGKAGGQPLVFGHGYGTDQGMWRSIASAFTDRYRTVTFDFTGRRDTVAADHVLGRYDTVGAYAADVVDLCRDLDLQNVTFVGHSVGGIIAVLAANAEAHRFASLVLISSSPRYVDDSDYVGGYTRAEIGDFLELLDSNIIGRPRTDAPDSIGRSDRRVRDARFARHFAHDFARATFLSDHRSDLVKVTVPTLILHGATDHLVPRTVGRYLARTIPDSHFELVAGTGHLPHVDAPGRIVTPIRRFLDR
jgi:sigma-B regulation protein RsbQ